MHYLLESSFITSDSASIDVPVHFLSSILLTEGILGTGLFEKIQQGGFTLIAQILLSLFGVTFIIERFFKLKRKSIVPAELAEKARHHWGNIEKKDLSEVCASHPSTLSQVIDFLSKHRGQPASEISNIAGDIAASDLEVQYQRIYPIAVVATLEPLLGLLGTVIGMIESFQTVALAGTEVDASLLADGISKALLTTAVGLAIAVPFLLIYHYFKSRISLYTIELEKEVTGLVSDWFMSEEGGLNEG